LNNFDKKDQKNFLHKYWRSLNLKHKERVTSDKLKQSARDLINDLKSINLNQFIGIPLQTKMLADIYFDHDFSNIKIANLADLYNEFIESNFRIQVEKANNLKIERLSKKLKNYFEDTKEKFYSDHIKLSSLSLFEQNNQNKIDLELNDQDRIQDILDYGVIVAFTNGVPTFLHQSFAEFFVAKSSFTKIEQNYDIELEQILRDRRHFLIRKFLNDLLEKKQQQNQIDIIPNNRDYKREIANCCRENLSFLLKYFIEQMGFNLKLLIHS
jgi:hypothetical protein